MPRRYLITITTLALGLLPVRNLRAEDGPVQYWLMTAASQRLDYSLDVILETENQFSEDSPTWRQLEYRPILQWNYSPRHDFQIGYQGMLAQDPSGKTFDGHQLILAHILHFPLGPWNISSRQRFQTGVENDESLSLFRHQVKVGYQDDRLPFHLMPYIADEWFLRLDQGDVRQNRLMVGLEYPLTDHINLQLFGMRIDEWMPDGTHVASPVTGFQIEFQF